MGSPVELFVSHRSSDATLARALVNLLRVAFKLSGRQIRCTSVDGTRLPVGAETARQLRQEIVSATVFIAVITPTSISSPYVLFEIGARWGADKRLAVVLARGAKPANLAGPLSTLNALQLTERSQVLQLVDDLALELKLEVEPASGLKPEVDAVVVAAENATEQVPYESATKTSIALESIEMELLTRIAIEPQSEPQDLANELNLKLERANYHLARLASEGLVYAEHTVFGETYYSVEQSGRSLLIQLGRL